MSSDLPGNGRVGGQGSRSLLAQDAPITDVAAERAVLGSLLLREDSRIVLKLLGRGLRPDCFYWSSHAAIYAAALSLAKRQVGIDPLTIHSELERLRIGEDISREAIDELAGYVPTSKNLSAYADCVIEKAEWRRRLNVAYEMLASVRALNSEAWEKAVADLLPEPPTETRGPTILRVVDEDGQVVGEERRCDSCRELQDQLDGVEKEVRGWRTRYAILAREKEQEAQRDPYWPIAIRLFQHWKKMTNRPRPEWTYDRWVVAEPLLKKYGPVVFEKAIAGIVHDPFKKPRLNGTTRVFNDWETLCKTTRSFEEYWNCAPKDWKPVLTDLEAPAVAPRPGSSVRQLAIVQGAEG